MANVAVTPPMRVHGWNVHFLAGQNSFHFAGLFQAEGSDLVTFRDVVDELRLCFEFTDAVPCRPENDNNEKRPWDDIAFGLTGRPSSSSLSPFVAEQDLDQPVLSLPSSNSKQPNILRYHLVHHKSSDCNLPSNSPLAAHLKAKCAQHLPRPVRRRDPRYLPPKRPSSDPRFSRMPLRRTFKARTGSQSPPKRSASGSVSPRKDSSNDANDEDVTSMVTPPTMNIAVDFATKTIAAFRSSCLVSANRCAVSGKGESWCISPAIGPALQACHIVPQQHYHVYPGTDDPDNDVGGSTEDSPRYLQEAWQQTWSPKNGILLMSHFHELFDQRLFSIHPETFRIRAFVPYDVLIDYNGRQAYMPPGVDPNALRHHYDMCCIENMAAQMPLVELYSLSTSRIATPGTNTPFSPRNDLPATPTSGQIDPGAGVAGDPSKRLRSTHGQIQSNEQNDTAEQEEAIDGRVCKRRRVQDCEIDENETHPYDDWLQDDRESYITP
ncbi:Uncharacterized protein TPAR_07325 [Tolypocladium paradoxum]|uniref:HNH nuclease domain-containing protein n=1 Tax=Tolypocladium paradoxum TaxID=94208 RepID=A0A2S4KQJ6_9HYPO|nr:Uncharacterized protein TPAR_07325 [Tolypocladium paradoxum]